MASEGRLAHLLHNCAFLSFVVPPTVPRRIGTIETHNRRDSAHSRHGRQSSQHGSARYVIVCAHTTLRMVALGSKSVAARSMCSTQSVPAREDHAYWKGAHSASNSEANCFARVRATNRFKELPVAMPLTAPSDLASAVSELP